MKKYQMWLERKTYSQHLNNLMRIKLAPKQSKPTSKLSMDSQRTKNPLNQSIIKSQPSLSSNQLQYIITSRQLQNHKLRLVRSNQIVRENEQMAKRIDRTRPFISNTRPVDNSNYKLKRKMQRANEQMSSDLKLKNYNEFSKLCKEDNDPKHRFQLKIQIHQLQLRIAHKEETEVAIEILAPNRIVKSEYIPAMDIQKHTFVYLFSQQLPDQFTLQIQTYRGLHHKILGSFVVGRPEEGQTIQRQWSAIGLQGNLKAKLTYRHKIPKIWALRPFKV